MAYLDEIKDIPLEKIAYVNESGIDTYLYREYGYAPRGQQVFGRIRGRPPYFPELNPIERFWAWLKPTEIAAADFGRPILLQMTTQAGELRMTINDLAPKARQLSISLNQAILDLLLTACLVIHNGNLHNSSPPILFYHEPHGFSTAGLNVSARKLTFLPEVLF